MLLSSFYKNVGGRRKKNRETEVNGPMLQLLVMGEVTLNLISKFNSDESGQNSTDFWIGSLENPGTDPDKFNTF